MAKLFDTGIRCGSGRLAIIHHDHKLLLYLSKTTLSLSSTRSYDWKNDEERKAQNTATLVAETISASRRPSCQPGQETIQRAENFARRFPGAVFGIFSKLGER